MRQESEYLKRIKEALEFVDESNIAEILNAYYYQCKREENPCETNKGEYIYNLMDNKQAADAVRHYGFGEISDVYAEKSDWILIVGYDIESKKHTFITEAPSQALERCLANILASYIFDTVAYPAFFREIVAQPLSQIITLGL